MLLLNTLNIKNKEDLIVRKYKKSSIQCPKFKVKD